MTRRTLLAGAATLALAAALLPGPATVQAHDSFRLTGKIVKWDKPTMIVASKEHGGVAVKVLDDFATILFKGKPATSKEIKVGQSVVVDAWGDSITDLEALKVNIDPPRKAAAAK